MVAEGETPPTDPPVEPAPWLQPIGVCPSCDRRRAVGAAEAKRQREKHRERRAKEKTDG